MAQNKPADMNHRIWEGLKASSRKVLHELDQNSEHAEEVNARLLETILADNAQTEFGREHGFADIHDADGYRARVPLSTYDDYEDAIDRMTEKGERNILSAYPVAFYASTSGTSGSPKKIPVSDRSLTIFRNYASAIMPAVISEFHQNTKYADFPDGYRFMVVSFSKEPLADGTMFGSISTACLNEESMKLMPYFVSTPPAVMQCRESMDHKYLHARYGLAHRDVTLLTGAYIPALLDLVHYIRDNWQTLVRDIREGTLDEDAVIPDGLRATLLEQLEPDPQRADELEAAFAQGFDRGFLRRIWPDLSGVSAIWAGNFSSYARKLQEYSGRSIPYYTMSYASSEGVFAVSRHPHDQNYVLVPDSCFFEFIPMDGKDSQAGLDNPKTVLIDEVEEGKDYELVITNQSGFYRYRMGDVIRIVGFYNESPMVVFKYRLKNIVSIAGEKFTEDHLLSAVREFERRTGVNIIDFCMYPDRDSEPGRYVICLEPDEPVAPELKDEYTTIMGEELARASTSYAHYVAGGNMGAPKLIFLQRETFQFFREMKMYRLGLNENQMKTVRVLNTPALVSFFRLLEEQ